MIEHYRGVLIDDGVIHFNGSRTRVPDPYAKIDQLLDHTESNKKAY